MYWFILYQAYTSNAPKPAPSTPPPPPPPPAEAKLNPVLVQEIQPIKRPNTYIPGKQSYMYYALFDMLYLAYYIKKRVDQQKHKI